MCVCACARVKVLTLSTPFLALKSLLQVLKRGAGDRTQVRVLTQYAQSPGLDSQSPINPEVGQEHRDLHVILDLTT